MVSGVWSIREIVDMTRIGSGDILVDANRRIKCVMSVLARVVAASHRSGDYLDGKVDICVPTDWWTEGATWTEKSKVWVCKSLGVVVSVDSVIGRTCKFVLLCVLGCRCV